MASTASRTAALDSLKCPICLDYASKAVETVCCGQIYCEKCIKNLLSEECPSCRDSELETIVSRVSRKIVAELPVDCPNSCQENITRSTLEAHEQTCPQREYPCPIVCCEFSGLLDHVVEHEAVKHKRQVFLAMRSWASEKTEQNAQTDAAKLYFCPFEECVDLEEQATAGMLRDHIFKNHSDEEEIFRHILEPQEGPIRIRNSRGAKATMAPNGKFYCHTTEGTYKPDKDQPKRATKMECTYENKLNCINCMKLDVSLRNLPFGYLVNGSGHVSSPNICNHTVKGSEYFDKNNRDPFCFYETCGHPRKFSCDMPNVDKQGKPMCAKGANQCKACEELSYVYTVADNRIDVDYYKNVWKK